MSIDPWLRELASVSREKQDEERNRLDERWDRLSSRDLSPEEEAELLALAESSEEGREAYEAFRPLGPEFHASVAKTLRERGLVPEAGAPAEKPAKLLLFRPRASHIAGWGSLAAGLAAMLVLLLRPASLPPLPSYNLADLEGGNKTWRGGEHGTSNGSEVFVPGSQLTLVAEPLPSIEHPAEVEAQGFAARGTELVPLQMKAEVAESGNVRLRGELGKNIRLSPGKWRIWVVVCRPGKLPTVDELRGKLNVGRIQHAGCQATVSEPFIVRHQA